MKHFLLLVTFVFSSCIILGQSVSPLLQKFESRSQRSESSEANDTIEQLKKQVDLSIHELRLQQNRLEIAILKDTENVFLWQRKSSIYIFWIVVAVVISGLVFSGIQFYLSYASSNKTNKEENLENKTELEISAQGVKLSSSIIGIIILVISLAFFYMYLIYVYPIKEIDRLGKKTVTKTEVIK